MPVFMLNECEKWTEEISYIGCKADHLEKKLHPLLSASDQWGFATYVLEGDVEKLLNREWLGVFQEGSGLVQEGHYARKDIHKRLEELELSWQALIAASADKKDRLQDAHQVGGWLLPAVAFFIPLCYISWELSNFVFILPI